MKYALITPPRGFYLIEEFGLSYHLVLAQHVLEGFKYGEFYRDRHDRGDFIILDNGAAEDAMLGIDGLMNVANLVRPDEIVMPDVICDKDLTIRATMDKDVRNAIPPKRRAIVPHASNMEEWFECAQYFVDHLEFATMCIPRPPERWEGGRVKLLEEVERLGWHRQFNIHILGVWGSPYQEVKRIAKAAPWARGIDTAMPLALAQEGILLEDVEIQHVSHSWTKPFTRGLAMKNIRVMLRLVGGYQ